MVILVEEGCDGDILLLALSADKTTVPAMIKSKLELRAPRRIQKTNIEKCLTLS